MIRLVEGAEHLEPQCTQWSDRCSSEGKCPASQVFVRFTVRITDPMRVRRELCLQILSLDIDCRYNTTVKNVRPLAPIK